MLTKRTSPEEGVGQMLTLADIWERGVCKMLILADKGGKEGSAPPYFWMA